MKTTKAAETQAALFAALSTESRVRIVQLLSKNTLCVGALSEFTGISAGAVSQHLQQVNQQPPALLLQQPSVGRPPDLCRNSPLDHRSSEYWSTLRNWELAPPAVVSILLCNFPRPFTRLSC